MKLSEILPDYPKNKELTRWPDMNVAINYYNETRTACDREIDREALITALNDYVYSSRPCEEGCDTFISTMPTWLKRIEK